MGPLTIFGGGGFVGGEYVRSYYDAAIGNIQSINAKHDYQVYSKDVLYFISTVDNYNVFEHPLLDIETNLLTLVTVLENWRKLQESRDEKEGVFNFISSWFVYGNQDNPCGVREDAVCDPKGFYSITKRCAEQLLISYCETYGLKYRILRLGNVLGTGDRKVSARKNALQYLIGRIDRGEDIQVYSHGEFYRDYIHVEDCVRAIELTMLNGASNEVYNIGNGKPWQFIEVLMYAIKELKSHSIIEWIEPKDFHKKVQINTFYMNNEKLRSLGYTPIYEGVDLYSSILPRKSHEQKNSHSRSLCETP